MRGPGYHFDRFGSYLGYIDPCGYYFAPDGTCRGMVGGDGTLVDQDGKRCGRFDSQGQFWDEQGTYRGYLSQPDGIPLRPTTVLSRGSGSAS